MAVAQWEFGEKLQTIDCMRVAELAGSPEAYLRSTLCTQADARLGSSGC